MPAMTSPVNDKPGPRWEAYVRPTGPELARCQLTHIPQASIDWRLAQDQHAAYVRALATAGARVHALERLPECPDAVFVEDAAVCLDEVLVLSPSAILSRSAEASSVAAAVRGDREVLRLEAPATLDGGDVLRCQDTLYVGQSTRTNHAALKALAHGLLPYGYRVKAVEVHGSLHLKTAMTLLDEETLLVAPGRVNLERVRDLERVSVHPKEPFAANVLRVGSTLIAASAYPRTAERIAKLGHDLHLLDLSELAKAEAGPTCLSIVTAPQGG